MLNGSVRTVHLRPEPQPNPEPPHDYERPDITLLGSIRMASEQIRLELKVIGEEKDYIGALRVLASQARIIAQLAEDQLDKLKSAVDTIPAAIMLAGGPPYRLTFTESCLKEIAESQK